MNGDLKWFVSWSFHALSLFVLAICLNLDQNKDHMLIGTIIFVTLGNLTGFVAGACLESWADKIQFKFTINEGKKDEQSQN